MSARRPPAGAGILTGPDEEGKTFPSVGAALSAAITRACHAPEACTYYVRDPDTTGRYAVERHDDRSVTVHTTTKEP